MGVPARRNWEPPTAPPRRFDPASPADTALLSRFEAEREIDAFIEGRPYAPADIPRLWVIRGGLYECSRPPPRP